MCCEHIIHLYGYAHEADQTVSCSKLVNKAALKVCRFIPLSWRASPPHDLRPLTTGKSLRYGQKEKSPESQVGIQSRNFVTQL